MSQIIEEEKRQRNILEIHLTKIVKIDENGEHQRPKSLTFEDLGEFIFDILEIRPEDCLAVNLNTGRYDIREVKLKSEIETKNYVRYDPVTFKGHNIMVMRQSQNVAQITFKNVPLN